MKNIAEAPICEECDQEMHRCQDPVTNKIGWGCDGCGWSYDDEAEVKTNLKIQTKMGLDLAKLPFNVLSDIRESLGATEEEAELPVGEYRRDSIIEGLGPHEALDKFLTWNGIQGYTGTIIGALDGLRKAQL